MNADIAPRKPCAHLSEDERDRAMLVLALNGSHAGKAHAQLKDEGLQVSERQLQAYRHWPRYQEIRKHKAAEIETSLVEHYKDAGRLSLELQIEATSDTLNNLKAGLIKPADTAKVAQQAAVASGIATDKALLLEGRPTAIVGNQDIQSITRQMGQRLGFDIDSTAEPLPAESPLIRESAPANPRAEPKPADPSS